MMWRRGIHSLLGTRPQPQKTKQENINPATLMIVDDIRHRIPCLLARHNGWAMLPSLVLSLVLSLHLPIVSDVGGIRTRARRPVPKTGALDHSATTPSI